MFIGVQVTNLQPHFKKKLACCVKCDDAQNIFNWKQRRDNSSNAETENLNNDNNLVPATRLKKLHSGNKRREKLWKAKTKQLMEDLTIH